MLQHFVLQWTWAFCHWNQYRNYSVCSKCSQQVSLVVKCELHYLLKYCFNQTNGHWNSGRQGRMMETDATCKAFTRGALWMKWCPLDFSPPTQKLLVLCLTAVLHLTLLEKTTAVQWPTLAAQSKCHTSANLLARDQRVPQVVSKT
jgi:hypothetical protein